MVLKGLNESLQDSCWILLGYSNFLEHEYEVLGTTCSIFGLVLCGLWKRFGSEGT